MSAKKQPIIDFIVKHLSKATPTSKIMELCGTKWDVSRSAFFRLLKKAQQQHIESQQEIKQAIKEVEVAGAVEAAKRDIMSAIERQEYLTQIIRGNIKVPNTKFQYDSKTGDWVEQDYEELPTHEVRVKAIAELNRMDGSYTPVNIDVKSNGESLKSETTIVLPSGKAIKA